MTRLTQQDWRVILAALAAYEADDLSDAAEAHGMDEDAYYAAVTTARLKVVERIAQEANDV